MINAQEIQKFKKIISTLESQDIKDEYWSHEKKVLKKVLKKTSYRLNLIQMSSEKLHKTFSL